MNNDEAIDKKEFVDMQFKAFRNCEDNIEFISKDIKDFDEKIKEVKKKMSILKEFATGYRFRDIPIMKGSTLSFNITDGEFDENYFDKAAFEPMIQILVNPNDQRTNAE